MAAKEFIQSREEMEEILRGSTLGFLGVCDGATPYVVPLTYDYQNGKILFHCALEGKKLDCIRKNAQVCFTVGRQYGGVRRHPQGARCSDSDESVVCYGTARILTDDRERLKALNTFNRSMQPGAEDIAPQDARRCCAVEIDIVRMTGRRRPQGEGHRYYQYTFRGETQGDLQHGS